MRMIPLPLLIADVPERTWLPPASSIDQLADDWSLVSVITGALWPWTKTRLAFVTVSAAAATAGPAVAVTQPPATSAAATILPVILLARVGGLLDFRMAIS